MFRIFISTVLLSLFAVNAKMRTIADLKLDYPTAKTFKEEVIYTAIFEKNNKAILEKFEALKKEQKLDALDYYQYKNFITDDGNFIAEYFVDKDLKILKELMINMDNTATFAALIDGKVNSPYVYDFLIYQLFTHRPKQLEKYLIRLKKSANQQKLFIKNNYQHNNYIYLERVLRSLKGEVKIIVYDLLIHHYLEGSTYKAAEFINERQVLEYDIEYSYVLVDIYKSLNKKLELQNEILKILSQKKDYALVRELLELNKNDLTEEDYQDYIKYVNLDNEDTLRYDMIAILYKNGLSFHNILKECVNDDDPRKVYYQAIEFCKNDKYRQAYLLLIGQGEDFQNNKLIKSLKSKLMIVLNIEINDESNSLFKLSKEIQKRQFLPTKSMQSYPYEQELNTINYSLIDFYESYENLIPGNTKMYLDCFLIYQKVKSKISPEQSEKIKEKVEALGFE